jgi:hypothetical protein
MAVNQKSMERQRIGALAIANQYRLSVAAERKRISEMSYWEGREALAEMIETTTDPALMSGKVAHWLRAVRKIGDVQVARFFKVLEVTDRDRRLRDLTYRQRSLLVDELRGRS